MKRKGKEELPIDKKNNTRTFFFFGLKEESEAFAVNEVVAALLSFLSAFTLFLSFSLFSPSFASLLISQLWTT